MVKRLLSLLLAALLLLGAASTVFAENAPPVAFPVEGGNLYFDTETQTVIAADDGITAIDLPAEINGVAVRAIKSELFYGSATLRSVKLAAGLERIGERAFSNCTSLDEVTLLGVRTVESNAFSGSYRIHTLTLEGVEEIGDSAFSYLQELTRITLPENLKTIGAYAFADCVHLTTARFFGDAPTMGREAFYSGYYNDAGELIYEPLTELTLYYLSDRAGWTTVTEYVTAPWNGATIPGGSLNYAVDGGELIFDRDTGTVSRFEGTLTHLELPEKINGSYVRRIANDTFSGQTALTTVTLPDSLRVIDDAAFEGCTSLRTLRLPERMQRIGPSAFEGCTSLQNVTLPTGLTVISSRTFAQCDALNYVGFPEGITQIDEEAFKDCPLLTRLVFPDSLTQIKAFAFEGCRRLETVAFPKGLELLGRGAFGGCTDLKAVTVPAAVRSFAATFQGCTGLREVYFLGDAPEQSENIFYGCDNVTVFFPADAAGWTTPEWNGCPAHPYPHVHGFVSRVVTPTCTEAGCVLRRCTCGEIRRTDLTEALGHSYQNDICVRCGLRDPAAQPPLPTVRFRDVSEKAWYAEAVEYTVRAEIMNGIGGGKFDPEGSMSRAMLVTVLWRVAGAPKTGRSEFTDVPAKAWYAEAVAWAAAKQLINGVGNKKFDPDGAVTREQLAAILYRYAAVTKNDVGKRGELTEFDDAAQIGAWAREALSWTVAEGFLGGSTENGRRYLDPQGTATRAQVAAILMRYLKAVA